VLFNFGIQVQRASRHRTAAKLIGHIAADMPSVPPALVKPTITAIAVIRAVVEGSQHMLLKNAIAPNSANPIAAAARAHQFRGLALIHDVTVSRGHSNWRWNLPLPDWLEQRSALVERGGPPDAPVLRGSK
jgi:hypothetical protein